MRSLICERWQAMAACLRDPRRRRRSASLVAFPAPSPREEAPFPRSNIRTAAPAADDLRPCARCHRRPDGRMRIVTPGGEERPRLGFAHVLRDEAGRRAPLRGRSWERSGRAAPGSEVARAHAERRRGLLHLQLAQRAQAMRRIARGAGMGPRSVREHDDLDRSPLSARGRDQRPAAEALIIGMGATTTAPPSPRRSSRVAGGKSRADRGTLGRACGSGPNIGRGARTIQHPLRRADERPIGSRLAKIGRKIADDALDRMRTNEGRKAD